MNKKLLLTTSLALALAVSNIGLVRADDLNEEMKDETKIEEVMAEKEEKVTEAYIVKEIKGDNVILNKKGSENDLYQVEKSKFEKMNLEAGKEVNITSDGTILKSNPAQFGKIYEIKEVIKETEKAPVEKVTSDFVVKEVNKDGVIVEKIGSESEKYMIEKKYFEDDVKVGDKYKITHNDVVTNSDPAQFNKIFEVKEIVEQVKETASITNIYKVKEVSETGVTLAYYSKEDGSDVMEDSGDLYMVEKKEFKEDVKVGDKYKITHTDEILASEPAQFAKITKIEKVAETKPADENKGKENKSKDKNTKAPDKKDAEKEKKPSDNNKNNKDNKNTKENKNMNGKVAGKNPKTGIVSSIGLVSLPLLSAAALWKSKKY